MYTWIEIYVNVINRIRDGSKCITRESRVPKRELGRRSVDAFLPVRISCIVTRFTEPIPHVRPTGLTFLYFSNLPFFREEHLNNFPAFLSHSLSSSANKSRERPCYSKWITFKPISRSSIFAHSFYSHNAVRYFRQEIFFLGSVILLFFASFSFSFFHPSIRRKEIHFGSKSNFFIERMKFHIDSPNDIPQEIGRSNGRVKPRRHPAKLPPRPTGCYGIFY